MIRGEVVFGNQARIVLEIKAKDGRLRALPTLIDTGFEDDLALPPDLIEALGLPYEGVSIAQFGNGSVEHVHTYQAALSWEGIERKVYALALDFCPMIGMRLLHGHTLTIEVLDGGGVTIDRL